MASLMSPLVPKAPGRARRAAPRRRNDPVASNSAKGLGLHPLRGRNAPRWLAAQARRIRERPDDQGNAGFCAPVHANRNPGSENPGGGGNGTRCLPDARRTLALSVGRPLFRSAPDAPSRPFPTTRPFPPPPKAKATLPELRGVTALFAMALALGVPESPLLLPLFLGLVRCASPPPSGAATLGCWFVEEAAGGGGGGIGSVMPSALRQRRAQLVVPPAGQRLPAAALEADVPAEVESGLAFQLLDPSGTLWSSREQGGHPLWLGADSHSPEAKAQVSCEINPYHPQEAHVPWAAGLVGQKGCPRSLEGTWVVATIQNPEVDFGVSSILHGEDPSPGKQEAAASRITTATAVLSVFTRTPRLQSRLGEDVLLDCGFSVPAVAFSIEWRHQYSGAGQVILAYDGATQRVSVAEEEAKLFLEPGSSNASLQLQGVTVRHEGTYICSIYLPHLQAQQAIELKVVEPPKVTFRPVLLLLSPGAHEELACEISGFYPPGVSVAWQRRGPGTVPELLQDSWVSSHRQASDGTFSVTSFASLLAAQPEDHGASYSCLVSHAGLAKGGLRKAVTLHVAGSSGPSLEDLLGLFLLAFVLLGLLRAVSRRALGETKAAQKQE